MTATNLKTLAKKVILNTKYGAKLDWNEQSDWQQTAHGYDCTLHYNKHQYRFDFWCGQAITKEPDAQSVLDCLLSDAQAGDMPFSEFCDEFGYDEDSRSAEKTWKACQKTSKAMRKLLGDDFDEFLHADRND